MSVETKIAFKGLVTKQHKAFAESLSVLPPVFVDDGYATNAIMHANEGHVELACGPADYNVELFIHDKSKSKTLSLVDLLAFPEIREWLSDNKPNYSNKERIEGKVEHAFRFLHESIGHIPQLSWILRKTEK